MVSKLKELSQSIKDTKDLLSDHFTSMNEQRQPGQAQFQTQQTGRNGEPLDITKEVKNYYLRVEIEHVFFQKLILEILRRHYGLKLSKKEEEWFNGKNEVCRTNVAAQVE